MHLSILIHRYHPHDCVGMAIPGHQHLSWSDAGGVTSVAQRGPVEPLIVFGVEARAPGRTPEGGKPTGRMRGSHDDP